MNTTPQSMRSPVSPYDDLSKQPFSARRNCYPATPQPEPAAMEPPTHGLGLYDCRIPQQQSTAHDLPPSPQQSDSWSHSSMVEQDSYPYTTQAPNIDTPAFDPFSGYGSHAHNGMLSAPSEEAPGLVDCQTPPSTNMPSHRSSISSSSSPHHHHAEFYSSRVKSEDRNEWYPSPGNEQVLQRSLAMPGYSPYSNGVSPISGPTEDFYKSHTSEWAKAPPAPYSMEFNNMVGEESRSRFDGAPVLPSVNRIKKKRQRTTPEEATHECNACGKLFKRSYNWKSHMETHNPERKYPHPCTAMIGSQPCSKKFQRKTDLDRHNDSVHLKARNHRCNLCGNRFARRDTLRRHTEDGCPKRFELGFRENIATPAQRWSLPSYHSQPRSRSYDMGGSMPPPSVMLPNSTQPPQQQFLGRSEYVSSPLQSTSSIFPS